MNLTGLPAGFKLGALQQARVLGVVEKRAILLVSGQALGVPILDGSGIKEGQQLQGRFVASSAGGYQFELQKSRQQVDHSISGRVHLGTFFKAHGIQPTDLNFLAGYKAMQMRQPLTPDLFQQVFRFSSLLPDFSESSVHSLLLAISSRFPVKRSTLKLGRDQALGDRNTVALLRGLFGLKSSQSLNSNQQRILSHFFPVLDDLDFNLKLYFERSGIDLEAQLKRDSINLEGEFFKLEDKGLDPLKKLIKDIMSFAKLFRTSSETSEQILQIPYLTDGSLQQLTLVVGRDSVEGNDDSEEVKSLSLYIDLSKLGPTMIGFRLVNGYLDLVFRNEDVRAVNFLTSRESEIVKSLAGLQGVRDVGVRTILSKVEVPDPFYLDEGVQPQRIDLSV